MTDREQIEQPPYHLTIRENGKTLTFWQPLADPFVWTSIRVRGWRNALRVLFRRYKVEVLVGGDKEHVERVLELDPDYLGPPGSPSRKAWDTRLNDALSRMGEPPRD